MIERVNSPGEVPQPRETKPLVLVPATAGDVARRKRRKILWISAAVVVVLLGAGYLYKRWVDPIHARQSYEEGMRLFAATGYPQAILAFDRAVALDPKMAGAYLMRGRANAIDGKIDAAIADFGKTLELRPYDLEALLARGREYMELKDYQSARADADRALAVDSRFAPAYNLRATAARALGDLKKGVEDFTRAIELSSDRDDYFQRGATYQMLGDHRRALADFDRMIAIQPDAAPAYYARAESRLALGDVSGAEQDRQQARALEHR